MDSPRFSYDITVRELIPPIGTSRYFAKVAHLYERTGSGEKLVSKYFSERYGATEEEARKNLAKDVDGWIAKQS